MSLEVIDNQPIHLTPPGESIDCKDCGGEACMLVEYNDYVYLQVKMTPCGDDFICGQPVASAELVVNGNFDGSTGWLEAGNNWTIAGGKACYTAQDGAGVLYQTIADLTEECPYLLSYTITDYVAGTLRPFLWSTAGTTISADGSYSEMITIAAGHLNEFLDFVDIGWEGCISNISLIALPCCWDTDFVDDNTITFTEDGACVDGSGELFTDTLANGPGYFVVTFTISNYVTGTVLVQGNCTDTFVGGPYSNNGEKFAYGVFAAPGSVCFEFTDFIGCVSDVHIHRLYFPQFMIQSQTNDTQYDLNDVSFLNFTEDRVTLKFRPLEFLFTDCYKICVIDTCRIAGPTNKVANGTFDTDLSSWNPPGNGSWVWDSTNGGQATFDRSIGPGALSQTFSVSDINVCVQITITDISTFLGSFLRLHLYDAANGSVEFLDISAAGTYTICGVGARLDLEPSNIANTIISIDNVGVFQITDCDDCSPFDYCSNCIKYVAEENGMPCTLLVEAYNDENGSWDFVWNNAAGTNVFKLQHRLDATLGNPKYPEDSVDYTFSTGETRDTFAQSEKFWLLHINQKDEIAHDCIRLQKRSDHLFITDYNGNRKEYWAEKGDYSPKWVDPAGSNLAPAEFRVKLKNKTLYNNLCS